MNRRGPRAGPRHFRGGTHVQKQTRTRAAAQIARARTRRRGRGARGGADRAAPAARRSRPARLGAREHGPAEISRIRLDEGNHAADRIRAHYHCLDFRDLQISYDAPSIKTVVEFVREIRPEIVITHSPSDYMPDHEFTSLLVRNACFAASAPNFDTGRRPGAVPA